MGKKSVPPTLFFPIIEGEKVQRVKVYPYPVRYQYTMKKKTLFCTLDTMEFVSLKENLDFFSNGGSRAFMTDPTQPCRHGSPSPRTTASTHLQSLPLSTPNSNFGLRTARVTFFSTRLLITSQYIHTHVMFSGNHKYI